MKLLSKQFGYGLALVLFTTAPACATSESKEYKGVMKSVPHATIKFRENSATMSDADKATLRNLVRDARDRAPVAAVTVAAWSDKELPRNGEKLLGYDRELADKRADAVETYIKDSLDIGNVDTFNMAEDSNWLAKTFGTSDSELKSRFSRRGAAAPVTNAEFEVIKNEGGPSEAVVVVEYRH